MAAVAIDLAAAAAAPTGLDMEVVTRAAGDAGGPSKLIRVDSDSALRSGDGIQVRLRVAQDAYVYVIHFGSSRSAMLLHPFSGRDEDALVRAGEQRAIPSADGFLSLDRRTGRESLYAFASPAPLASLSSLLVRMEAVGTDREAVMEMVRDAYPGALALNFSHVKALAQAPSAVPPVTQAATSSAFEGMEEQGVLSAEGSKIQAFVGGEPLQPEKSVTTAASAPTPQPQPPSSKPAATGSWLGKLFSLGGAESGTTSAVEPDEPATTFALPAAADTGPPEAAAETAAQTAASSDSSATATVPAAQTTVEARESPSPSAPPTVGANPQLDVAALDAVFASLEQPTEAAESTPPQTTATGEQEIQTGGIQALPQSQPAAPSSDTHDPSQPVEPPAAGLIGTLETLIATVPPPADAPPEVAAAMTSTAASAPAQAPTVTEARPPETPTAPQAQPAAEAFSTESAPASSDGGGLFSRLFGSADSSEPTTTATATSPQSAAGKDPPPVPVEAEPAVRPAPPVPVAEVEPAPSNEGGFLSGLFGGPESSEPDRTAASTTPQPAAAEDTPPESVGAASEIRPVAEVSAAQAEPVSSNEGGLFSRLFGAPSSASTTDEPAVAARAAGLANASSPASEPTPADSPAVRGKTGSLVEDDGPTSTVVIGPARSDSESKKTVVIGPASTPEPDVKTPELQAQQSASELDPAAPAQQPSGNTSVSEAPSSGFLAGLFSSSPPTTELPEPEDVTVAPPAAAEAPAADQAADASRGDAAAESTSEGGSGGLLSGLSGWFSGTAADQPPVPDSAVSAATKSAPGTPAPDTAATAAPSPEEAAVAAQTSAETAAASSGESPAAAAPETDSGGVLGGLAGLFSGAASTPPEAAATQARSSPTAEPEAVPQAVAPEPETVAVTVEVVEQPTAEAAAEATPEGDSVGLLGGLASWFSTSAPAPDERAASDTQTQAATRAPNSGSPVVTAPADPEPVVAESADGAAAGTTDSGGIFGGLAKLFGGSEPSTQSSESEVQAAGSVEAEPAVETPEPAPAFKKVTRADGQTVVILQGPPGRPDAPAGSSEVLAAEGSKIRALLNPEPEPPAAAALVASPPVDSPPTEIRSRPIPPEADSAAADTSLTASTQASVLNTGVTQPAASTPAPVSVEPDEVQAALAAGAAAATRPAAETLAALTAPAAVPELEVAPVAEIDVTADDNVSSSIVLVVTPTGTGSGVLLDDAGHVLVNWHVVTGYPTVSVSFKAANTGFPSAERTFSARVVRLNKTADLALLRIEDPPDDMVPVRFADASQIHPGDVLHAIGHPASGAWTHTLGKISNVKPESSWYAGRNLLHRGTVLQAKVLDDPGSAGAPLFNNRLELVGISALSRTKKGVLTGVSVETIRLFLEAPPPGG